MIMKFNEDILKGFFFQFVAPTRLCDEHCSKETNKNYTSIVLLLVFCMPSNVDCIS